MTSVKQYVTDSTESIPLLWFLLRDFSTLNNTNCVNYIDFIIDIKLSTNLRFF